MNNVALCTAVEKIANVEIPERAQYIRMIGCELARISSHLLWLGTLVMDAGAVSFFIWTFKEREKIYDIMDRIGGHRFTISHARIGGVANDLTYEATALIKEFYGNYQYELWVYYILLV